MFGYFRRRRQRRLLAEPFPAWQETIVRRNMPVYDRLTPTQRQALQTRLRLLIAEKQWRGCKGLHLTEEIKLTIAAWAGLLILALDYTMYDRILSILIYPEEFATPNPEDDWEDDELSDFAVEGLAVYRGPVILSWATIQAEVRDPYAEQNLILHEFSHQLDFLDGASDGTPPIEDDALARRWGPTMQAAYDRHRNLLALGRESFLTEHAGSNESEFFADAVEAFYCVPGQLHEYEPEVFQILSEYFRLDPRDFAAPQN